MTSRREGPLGAPPFRLLQLDAVTRSFAGTVALDALTVDIAAGEFIALLGPSGCGKSTALNCLAGLLPLTGGEIRLDDQRVDVLPPEKRDFGMVFQSYALFPHLTVRRNIAFGLHMRRVPKAEVADRVAAALDLVQLASHADKLPRQLSGGQQQRVAIARAVAMRPRLVLMDEPLSNLDAKLRLDMRAEIRRLHRDLGLTTIYVTHDQEEALALADRLVVLRDGVTQQIGAPEELYDKPANLYVASFMGYRNSLTATVAGINGRVATLAVPGARMLGHLGSDALVAGAAATVVFRPEDVVRVVGGQRPSGRDDHDDSRPGTGNELTAVVHVVEYHGRESSVAARTAAGETVWFSSAQRLAVDDTVVLQIAPERLLVFPREGAAIAHPTPTPGGGGAHLAAAARA